MWYKERTKGSESGASNRSNMRCQTNNCGWVVNGQFLPDNDVGEMLLKLESTHPFENDFRSSQLKRNVRNDIWLENRFSTPTSGGIHAPKVSIVFNNWQPESPSTLYMSSWRFVWLSDAGRRKASSEVLHQGLYGLLLVELLILESTKKWIEMSHPNLGGH